jgi:hypothetical protein
MPQKAGGWRLHDTGNLDLSNSALFQSSLNRDVQPLCCALTMLKVLRDLHTGFCEHVKIRLSPTNTPVPSRLWHSSTKRIVLRVALTLKLQVHDRSRCRAYKPNSYCTSLQNSPIGCYDNWFSVNKENDRFYTKINQTNVLLASWYSQTNHLF